MNIWIESGEPRNVSTIIYVFDTKNVLNDSIDDTNAEFVQTPLAVHSDWKLKRVRSNICIAYVYPNNDVNNENCVFLFSLSMMNSAHCVCMYTFHLYQFENGKSNVVVRSNCVRVYILLVQCTLYTVYSKWIVYSVSLTWWHRLMSLYILCVWWMNQWNHLWLWSWLVELIKRYDSLDID